MVLLISTAPPCFAKPVVVPMAVVDETAAEYQVFLAKHGGTPQNITHLEPKSVGRGVAEILIIAKALHLGGLDFKFRFIKTPNARRETEEVATGFAVICSQQFNKNTLLVPTYKDLLYISPPITRFGEFQKGIYCLPENKRILDIRTAKELDAAGTAIIGSHWNNDFQILTAMGIRRIERAPTFNSIFKMLAAGRGDWIPLEFPNSGDLSITRFGMRLVPVPGVKFSLLESRHFLISRKHPLGKQVYEALEKGIVELRKQGFIRETLTAAGFFNDQTASWKMLNQPAVDAGLQE